MNVALFYMIPGNRRHGGAAYTKHLYDAMLLSGMNPSIFTIGKTTADKQTELMPGVMAQRLSLEAAVGLAEQWPSLVMYAHFAHFEHETSSLLYAGAGLIMHSTAELHPKLLDLLRRQGRTVVAIREALAGFLGAASVPARFIPHPYNRAEPVETVRGKHSVSLSRVDFAKHIELIAEANIGLRDRAIKIHGEMNRLYVHHSLAKKFPNWADHYNGGFELGDGVKLARAARTVVDLSYWKGDGGGTQYTFLEAWDTRTPLIVHERWHAVPGSVDKNSSFAVGSALELSNSLIIDDRSFDAIVDEGERRLLSHNHSAVVPAYKDTFKW